MTPNSKIEDKFRLKATQKTALKKMGVVTVQDLLYYFPARYGNISELKSISNLQIGDHATIYGKVIKTKISKAFRKKMPITEATIEDNTGKIKATWFHQAYVSKMLPAGSFVKLSGKVTESKSGKYLANPQFERTKELPIDTGDSLFSEESVDSFAMPIYPERKGISSSWIFNKISQILKNNILDKILDPIPEKILKKYSLPKLKTALVWVHAPKKEKDSISARKRFAFEEIFFIQLARQQARLEYENNPSFKIKKDKKELTKFIDRFPFKLTKSQQKSIDQIVSDMSSDKPMSRLLEGDVGSGKTAVAASTAYTVIATQPDHQDFGNLQVAYMAPTEILAKQHFESFIEYFTHLNLKIGLLTSSGCKKFPSKIDPLKSTNISRSQLLKWVANGEIPILIGTHSLIQKSVDFKDLAYVIIDEQHRFGTKQRSTLVRKDWNDDPNRDFIAPHLLSMTATPIPRTLALTIYGDLDLTLLDEMPSGRKQVITEIVLPTQREKVYEQIKSKIDEGRQLYVICPRINEPDPDKARALNVKSVKEEAKRLKRNIFPDKEIDILHSKLKKDEKEKVMQKFSKGEIDILVATSVIEVGVNVPNATMIIIEGAERFGLAQLHQLRGRVIRSNHQAYCFIFSETKTQKTLERLRALKTAKNGFELSELDLNLRGAGELSGKKQWGISDLGMEAIRNIKMVEAAREEAREILKNDTKLKKHPQVKKVLETRNTEIHFE